MAIKTFKPVTPSRRHQVRIDSDLTDKRPEKSLTKLLPKNSGRNSSGKVTVRHQGGRQKRMLRQIDFKRNKYNVEGKIVSIEYDPNRSAHIALVHYSDGEKRYILAPVDLKITDKIISGDKVEIKVGNSLPLKNIPLGMPIHNLELTPKKGGQMVRGAGGFAVIQSKEEKNAVIKLPSGELRRVPLDCYATIGRVGNIHKKNIKYGKAGRKRLLGIRPSVRGVAMHPGAHPHGGGEGRSGIGMPSPKSPWGKKTLGKKTRKKKKYSNKDIVSRRK